MTNRDEGWLLKEKYHGEKTAGFFADCERLKAGEPLAYVIGSTPFLNATIWLDSKPLIPRVETEYWVEILINQIKAKNKSPLNILDLCAGSGCIGIALARAFPTTNVHFAEIDEKHISTIKKNCLKNNITEDRTNFFESNLFSAITPDSQYDLIVSNPPYIDADLNRVDESVQNYEPALALYGGKSGMDLINKIIDLAPLFLSKNGELWLEHEPEQSILIKDRANHTYQVTTQLDQYKTERFSQLVLQ